jgi:dolichol-phosphate mannosyltransferase
LSYASDSHLVVIPTYNEIDNIEEFIIQISNFDVSVLIVDDNSPDGTGKVVEDITKINKKINLMKRNEKLGLGSAYRDGFKWGLDKGYSYLLEMDADFSHRFEDLVKILEASSSADMIIGSRYIEEGGSIGWDTRRKMLSSFANKLSKFLLKTKINDMTSGFRCYSNKALLEISYATTKSDGYAFQVEMSARAVQKQLSIKEVPIIFNERRLGNSKMSKKIVYEAFLYLVKNGLKRWLKIKIV